MKILVVVLGVICLTGCSVFQKMPPPPPEVPPEGKECVFKQKYTVEELQKMYPFNEARTVKLISYSNKEDFYKEEVVPELFDKDSILPSQSQSLVKIEEPSFDPYQQLILNNELIIKNPKETLIINELQKDSLSSILFNFGYKKKDIFVFESHRCFTPRNAIVFYDKKDNPFAYIEVCFQCGGEIIFPDKLSKSIEFCERKNELLKDFFRKAGIKYGIEEH